MAASKRTLAEAINADMDKRTLRSLKDPTEPESGQVDFHFRISKKLRDELKEIFDREELTLNGGIRFALREYITRRKNRSAI